jgi:hydrogenase maturation protease
VSNGVLIAGIGNIFSSDDGFGVEVANRLAQRTLPPGVRVTEFGIRGVHLAYELLEGYDALILADAVPMGSDAAGTLAVIEADAGGWLPGGVGEVVMDAHTMSPDVVLGLLAHLGGSVPRIVVIGCQPATLEDGIGLSPPVADAVEGAVELCLHVVEEILSPAGKGTTK